MNTEFKDHFSENAEAYRIYRPRYPKQLFAYLSSLSPYKQTAWDCATGNGQSALALSEYFPEVVATDASKSQIDNVTNKQGVIFRVEKAEETSLENNSVDLITVAQAVHWFNISEFSDEVIRVLKNNGVLAIWSYGSLNINVEINAVIDYLYRSLLDPYWPPERIMIENGYKDIVFPLQEIEVPDFQMLTEWDLSQLIGYLCTWSAVKKYHASKGDNPVDRIRDKMLMLWGDPEQKKTIHWPLTLKVWINKE